MGWGETSQVTPDMKVLVEIGWFAMAIIYLDGLTSYMVCVLLQLVVTLKRIELIKKCLAVRDCCQQDGIHNGLCRHLVLPEGG